MVGLDKRQCQINSCGNPCGRPHIMIRDEDAVGLDPDLRITLLQLWCETPMRRCAAAIEQSSFCQEEGARADARNADGSCHKVFCSSDGAGVLE